MLIDLRRHLLYHVDQQGQICLAESFLCFKISNNTAVIFFVFNVAVGDLKREVRIFTVPLKGRQRLKGTLPFISCGLVVAVALINALKQFLGSLGRCRVACGQLTEYLVVYAVRVSL